ncbi:MAG: hypothetical protein AB7F74_05060 [Parvibaculaceae bacterium]
MVVPDHCQLQTEGFVWREFFCRLPQGFIADHLNSRPEAWALLQARPNRALRKFDRMTAIAWDESWLAEMIVASADFQKVIFGKPRITTFPERLENLLQDERFKIEWCGIGYVVRRKADNVVVSSPVPSVALAERDLRNQYPQRL